MPTARCAGMRVRDRRPPSDAETSYLDRRRNAAYNLLSLSAAFRAPPGLCGRASHRRLQRIGRSALLFGESLPSSRARFSRTVIPLSSMPPAWRSLLTIQILLYLFCQTESMGRSTHHGSDFRRGDLRPGHANGARPECKENTALDRRFGLQTTSTTAPRGPSEVLRRCHG